MANLLEKLSDFCLCEIDLTRYDMGVNRSVFYIPEEFEATNAKDGITVIKRFTVPEVLGILRKHQEVPY